MTVPAPIPVTTPVDKPTVATAGLLLTQVPPVVVSLNVVLVPVHITVVPVIIPIVMSGYTVTM